MNTNLSLIAADPKLVGRLCDLIGSMPNIEYQTIGGIYYWNTLEVCNGWKLQRNKLTNQYRILNPDNVRMAWGPKEVIVGALKNLQIKKATSARNMVHCSACGIKVPNGKFCKECGSRLQLNKS